MRKDEIKFDFGDTFIAVWSNEGVWKIITHKVVALTSDCINGNFEHSECFKPNELDKALAYLKEHLQAELTLNAKNSPTVQAKPLENRLNLKSYRFIQYAPATVLKHRMSAQAIITRLKFCKSRL